MGQFRDIFIPDEPRTLAPKGVPSPVQGGGRVGEWLMGVSDVLQRSRRGDTPEIRELESAFSFGANLLQELQRFEVGEPDTSRMNFLQRAQHRLAIAQDPMYYEKIRLQASRFKVSAYSQVVGQMQQIGELMRRQGKDPFTDAARANLGQAFAQEVILNHVFEKLDEMHVSLSDDQKAAVVASSQGLRLPSSSTVSDQLEIASRVTKLAPLIDESTLDFLGMDEWKPTLREAKANTEKMEEMKARWRQSAKSPGATLSSVVSLANGLQEISERYRKFVVESTNEFDEVRRSEQLRNVPTLSPQESINMAVRLFQQLDPTMDLSPAGNIFSEPSDEELYQTLIEERRSRREGGDADEPDR